MKFRETPKLWQQTALLYRRRTGQDSLGNETAVYGMEQSDGAVLGSFQFPQGWNPSGKVGSFGQRTELTGEEGGGVLEGFVREDTEVCPFDRLKLGDEVWEVRAIHPWPQHRRLLLRRIQ